ncbi:hypothetical protein ACFLQO_01270 [Candidatus Aenigmatarchaeota archaeon]
MVKISDLNKKERDVRKTLTDIENRFKNNRISKRDYNSIKRNKETELKKIELERKRVIAKLPPIPPPPRPSRSRLGSGPSTSRSVSSASMSYAPASDNLLVEVKKHEKDILFTQSEMSKLFSEVVKNRERIKSMESSSSKMGSVNTGKIDVRGLEDKISNEIQTLNKSVMDNVSKSRQEVDRMGGEIRNLRRDIEEFKGLTSKLDNLDVAGLRRDIESLREKNKWLEQQINSLDMEPLYELIKEVEGRVASSSRYAAPVIIE